MSFFDSIKSALGFGVDDYPSEDVFDNLEDFHAATFDGGAAYRAGLELPSIDDDEGEL